MDIVERRIAIYLPRQGESPFEEWFDNLADLVAQQKVLARIARVRAGNLGDWKAVGDGVIELRINHGPGYRLYIGQDGEQTVILLTGGDKKSQKTDIEKAKRFWHEYKQNKKANKL